ncbi:hypothetical protein [Thermoplasma volcanium GSS1]|uniref:CRISPR-associated endonuclease Cas1 n=1 Tax=Thermoplasma volcanium (strain ATCC 51530 / DSM 4299 / JCM 9571 / NBRC 15438 / GSS1) TaxID=273116 RepID=Q97CJ6_THEVO|nr:type I-B CRISPR-associated endonuclease Cas1b [Thermoplasma volcanium]BAB59247.1 hypothetical protein [Thermoplasma volcanium GSS1]
MYNFYITQDGTITREGNTLYFIGPDFKRHLPVMNVQEIIISAKVSLSSWALDYLSKLGIIVHIISTNGKYMSSLIPGNRNERGNTTVQQVKAYLSDKRFKIAAEMVNGIKNNILANLRYYSDNNEITKYIKAIESYNPDYNSNDINKILGVEGNIWSTYYSAFPFIYKKYPDFKREFYPPKDELNAMISYGNALLYATVLTKIFITGLNPSISFLHEPSERSFSLALDIADIFKPVIVERTIANLVNKNIMAHDSFRFEDNGCYLSLNGRRKFIEYYNEKLNTVIKIGNNYLSYNNIIEREAYNLLNAIRNDEDYKSFRSRS